MANKQSVKRKGYNENEKFNSSVIHKVFHDISRKKSSKLKKQYSQHYKKEIISQLNHLKLNIPSTPINWLNDSFKQSDTLFEYFRIL